jgi:hypothetical protein
VSEFHTLLSECQVVSATTCMPGIANRNSPQPPMKSMDIRGKSRQLVPFDRRGEKTILCETRTVRLPGR